jgi:mannose-1-phosphate guanylyltransferase
MKAFILAAGCGTRLRPITDTMPKCLVPIRGVPMLSIWLSLCQSLGVEEVTINLHSHAQAVRKFLAPLKLQVRVRISEEAELLGSAGTLRHNRPWIQEEDRFWVFYGDVLTTANLAPMLAFHDSQRPAATLGLYRAANPISCGIATVGKDGMITDFEEKPMSPKGDLAFSGVMVGTPAMLDEIPAMSPADIGFHLLPRLVRRMAGFQIQEYLRDIGTLEAYTEAQREWSGLRQSGESESGRPECLSASRKLQGNLAQETSC